MNRLAEDERERIVAAAAGLAAKDQLIRRLHDASLRLATNDAALLIEALQSLDPTRESDRDVLTELADRFVKQARYVTDAADALAAYSGEQGGESLMEPALDRLAREYGTDAGRERVAANVCRLFSAAMLMASVAAAVWAVGVVGIAGRAAAVAPVGPLLVCGAAALSALLLLHAATRHDRAGREYTRLQRGVSGLGAYLEPLPAPARHLLRAKMTQTLFPRLLEDDDPIREPEWPDSRTLMYAVYEAPPPDVTNATKDNNQAAEVPEGQGPSAGKPVGGVEDV